MTKTFTFSIFFSLFLVACGGGSSSDQNINAIDPDDITDPLNTDSDNDGISDADEQTNGTDPLKKDSDNDGLDDGQEGITDSDGDGIIDALEPANIDADNDGVFDQQDSENVNPNNDSDSDGFSNTEEKLNETDPLESLSVPKPFKFNVSKETIRSHVAFTGAEAGKYTVKTNPDFSYDYSIDCNSDGFLDAQEISSDYNCEYNVLFENEQITITIYGKFPSPNFSNDKALVSVEQWGTFPFESMHKAFQNTVNMEVNAIDRPNLKNVSDMSYMFAGTISFNQDISNWDVSSVTDMSYMFKDKTPAIITIAPPNLYAFKTDLSLWDISNVNNMTGMFENTNLSTANYDKLLNAWSNLNLKTNVTFDAYLARYSQSATDSRQKIIDLFNWDINDAGLAP